MSLEKIYFKVLAILKKAGKIYYNKKFTEVPDNYKYENDDVTSNDIETQKFLVKELSKLIENCGFVAEEKLSQNENSEYVWIIDPIDGTFNYKNGINVFGTQVALQKNKKTIFSALYLPAFKEIYYSYNNKSYCNGNEITSSKNKKAKSVALNIHLKLGKTSAIDAQSLFSLFRNRKVCVYGSSLFIFCLVASGKIDCVLINSNTPWDIEPGLLLAVNAGAAIHYIKENKMFIIAGNESILQEIKKELNFN